MIYDLKHAYRLLNGGYVLATCREGLGCWPWAADAAEARGSRTLLCSCVQSETCCCYAICLQHYALVTSRSSQYS